MNPIQAVTFIKLALSRLARDLPTATEDRRGLVTVDRIGAGSADAFKFVRKTDAEAYEWADVAVASEVVSTQTVQTGSGDPEGVVTAPVGTLWLRSDGGASTTFYVKETGVGNTGWAAK